MFRDQERVLRDIFIPLRNTPYEPPGFDFASTLRILARELLNHGCSSLPCLYWSSTCAPAVSGPIGIATHDTERVLSHPVIRYSDPLGIASASPLRFLLTYRYQSAALSSIYFRRERPGVKSSREAPSGRTRIPPSRTEVEIVNSLSK